MAEQTSQEPQKGLTTVRHTLMVLSGKGGVGKSTFAVHLAVAFHGVGHRVGLLDVDVHGPSVPALLGLEKAQVLASPGGVLLPVDLVGLKVLSVGFMLADHNDAVIWRGPLKAQLIRQFLNDVAWGELDYLIIDAPPGTGDEPLSVIQLAGSLDGAVVVTTPQKLAALDVRKAVTFLRRLNVPIVGIVENMSCFLCPHCGQSSRIFPEGESRKTASDMDVPFLGAVPIDPQVAEAADQGRMYLEARGDSPAWRALSEIAEKVKAKVDRPAA